MACPILIFYCCITNYNKFSALMQIYDLTASRGQQFGSAIHRGLHQAKLQVLLGLCSHLGLWASTRLIGCWQNSNRWGWRTDWLCSWSLLLSAVSPRCGSLPGSDKPEGISLTRQGSLQPDEGSLYKCNLITIVISPSSSQACPHSRGARACDPGAGLGGHHRSLPTISHDSYLYVCFFYLFVFY